MFRPGLVTTPELREHDPVERDSQAGIERDRAERLPPALLYELYDADDALLNAGLVYLLALAWQAYLDSENVVAGTDASTPRIEAVARTA